MHFQLFSDYPAWFRILCLLAGGLYAFAFYFREKKIRAAISEKWWRYILAGARFIAVTILAFLLLNPYLKSRFNQTDKPILIIAMDNSASVAKTAGDSAKLAEMSNSINASFKKDFDVRNYTFGESLKEGNAAGFHEKNTDMSTALSELNNLYENLNVAGIVMISDGIYNTGSNPVYVKNELGAPIYSAALGDTVPKKDIRIARTLHNNIVYLKDKFSLVADVDAIYCKDASTKITVAEISKGNTIMIGEKNIAVNDDQFSATFEWEISADAPGIRHYQVRVAPVSGEVTTDNNIEDIYIEVLDARQKVLLLANAPHPDINALKQSIESNQNYQVDIKLVNELKGPVTDYDLIILHQLPSIQNNIASVLKDISVKNIPVLFIVGSQTSILELNSAQNLVKINAGGQSANEVTGTSNTAFNLFTLDEKILSVVPRLPAINAPFGQYSISPATQVLLNQKIGSVSTKDPLLIYSLPGAQKKAVLCAENFWKWRLYDYVLNNNQDATNELISKTIQYLSAKNDKKQFRVTQPDNVLNENEKVVFDGELYNDSYELINEPDATITIKNETGEDFPFQFSKTKNSYSLDAGYFPAGNYTFDAAVSYNGQSFQDHGAFSISPVRLESMNTTANHRLLNQLAVQSGGKMIYPNQTDALNKLVRENAAAKPVMHEITKTQSIINLKWLFFVITGLLALEWFIRKYNGGY